MSSLSQQKTERVLAHMSDGWLHTASDLADELGFDKNAVCHTFQKLRQLEKIHIVKWRNHSAGGIEAMHVIGPGENAPKPVKKKSKKKKKAKIKAIRKIDDVISTTVAPPFVPFRDPLTAAFYGEYSPCQ